MITMIDYGGSNLRSVQKALEFVGAQVEVTDDPAGVARAEKLVLPGVGAFGAGMKALRERGLAEAIIAAANNHIPRMKVDRVLIDDARTPLIISGPVPQGLEEQEYIELNPKIEKLFGIQRQQAAELLAEARKLFKEGKTGHTEGEGGLSLFRVYRALPKYRPLIKYLSEEGIKVILQKTENVYMQEQSKNMHLADAPLYFTIDEKNRNVELTEKGIEYLSRGENDPNFFVLPDITHQIQELTARETREDINLTEEKETLIQDYAIKSRRLHATSQLLKAYTLFDKDQE